MPTTIAIIIVGLFLILQIVGELLEFKGKVVPEFVKIRKYFARKSKEKGEVAQALKDVQALLSAENVAKRHEWMEWVNSRAKLYDTSIDKLGNTLTEAINALKENTKMTEELFVQSSRDRIIDFATKVGDENAMVSREEFNRIFKVYTKYEAFLKEHNMTNGEIDIAYHIIEDAYANRMVHHNFIEDIRGYNITN